MKQAEERGEFRPLVPMAEYNNVEVYMSFTRKKLLFVEAKTEIKAVRGGGYELRYGNV